MDQVGAKEGPATEKERHAWLKAEHGLGMNYAGWIAEHSVGKGDDGNPETYLKQAKEFVESMYSGAKEPLRPIFNELLTLGRSLGNDVKVCPVQDDRAAVPQTRFCADQTDYTDTNRPGTGAQGHQSAKAAHRYRRLAKKDRITHRIEITSLKDIDAEVKKWLKTAYEMDR